MSKKEFLEVSSLLTWMLDTMDQYDILLIQSGHRVRVWEEEYKEKRNAILQAAKILKEVNLPPVREVEPTLFDMSEPRVGERVA